MKRIRQGGEGRGGVAGVRRRGPYLRGLTQPRNRLGTRPHAGLAHPPEIAEAELGHALKARDRGGVGASEEHRQRGARPGVSACQGGLL